jgi:hypothetical protein
MDIPQLNCFSLVGGTSLALQLGHRTSVDLDFFSSKTFDLDTTRRLLGNQFQPFALRSISSTGFSCFIQDIKCDFFNWSVPFIGQQINEDNIRLCSLEDIAAFKFDAIITRKEKKDFRDIDALLDKFSFKELLKFYRTKFIYNDIKIVLDALSEIDIADISEEPTLIIKRNWEDIKQRIKGEWKQYQFEKLHQKEEEKLARIEKAEELLKNKKDESKNDNR